MSGLDDDFEALLNQAEVKEDFIDCGFDLEAPEPLTTPVQQDGSFGVVKLEEDRRRGPSGQGKKFKVKMIEDSSELCLRCIGSGASFCLRKNCSINHGSVAGSVERASFEPSPGGEFVTMKNLNVAFSSPTLKVASVEEEVVDTWEGASCPVTEWQECFQASNQGKGLATSIDDIKAEAKASRLFDPRFQRPAKKSKRVAISEPDPEFAECEPLCKTNEDCSAFKKSATLATLAQSVLVMDRTLVKLIKGVSKMFLDGTLGSRETEVTSDKSFRMAKGLESLVGSSKVMEDLDWVCPTVWGTLATLGAEVSSLKDRKVPPPTPAPVLDLGPIKTKIKADVNAEIKVSQAKLTASMTKISTFARAFSRLTLQ
jgi:hypothetical protein